MIFHVFENTFEKKQKSRNKVLGLRFWSRFWRPILVQVVESPSKTNVFRELRDDFGRAFGITFWHIFDQNYLQKYIILIDILGVFFDTQKISNLVKPYVKAIFVSQKHAKNRVLCDHFFWCF